MFNSHQFLTDTDLIRSVKGEISVSHERFPKLGRPHDHLISYFVICNTKLITPVAFSLHLQMLSLVLAKGRSCSMFTPYATSTTSKYNHIFLYRKRTKPPFAALHGFAAFIQLQPNGCGSSRLLQEILSFTLQVSHFVQPEGHSSPASRGGHCLPTTASGRGTSRPQTLPWRLDLRQPPKNQPLLNSAYKDTKVPF